MLGLGVEIQVDLAADAAERARRPDLLERTLGAFRSLLELLVDRSRGADGETPAAELALGVEPREPPRGDDARVPASALERECGALHDLLRVAHAAIAEDAGVRVVAHQLVAVRVLLALGVRQHERRLDPELVRHVAELVRPAARRVVQVLGQEHLGERLLELGDRPVRGDDHSFRDAGRAGGQRAGRALDVDDAHPAAAVRIELRVVAESRDERPVPCGCVDDELALRRGRRPAVESELDHVGHCTAAPSGSKSSGHQRIAFRTGNGDAWPRPQIDVFSIARSHSSIFSRLIAASPCSSSTQR